MRKPRTSTLQRVNNILLLIAGGLLLLILALLLVRNSVIADKAEQDVFLAPAAAEETAEHPDEEPAVVQDEDGMVSVNAAMVLEGGRLNVEIANAATNPCYAQVRIELAEPPYAGQTVYSSGIIRPGYSIKSGEVLERLPAGNYAAVAVVSAIDPETEDVTETVRANIVIEALSTAGQGGPTGAEDQAGAHDGLAAAADEPGAYR